MLTIGVKFIIQLQHKKEALSKRFDELFATTTDYEELNERILKTLAKKTALLQVLELPLLPLHNNNTQTMPV